MKHFSILLFAFFSTIAMFAQPGTIDKSYGTNNTGTISVVNQLFIQCSAIQQDDKLLLGGYGSKTGQYLDYILTRQNKDGSLDGSFGNKGQTITTLNDLVKNIISSKGWQGITVQPDGKLVTTGTVVWNDPDYPDNFKFNNDIVVARFLPDGTPDESFGSHGRVVTNLGYLETSSAVAIQEDGKIVVAGYQTENVNGSNSAIILVRYNTDGSLDTKFGGGGYVKYTKTACQANALLIQPDNKIVAGGSLAGGSNSFFLVRYLPDGSVDGSFGNEGQVVTSFPLGGSGTQVNSLTIDKDSRIAATGVIGSEEGVGVTRYLPNGDLDNTFNKSGKLELSFNGAPYANANTILTQPDGKLVVSSSVVNNNDTLWRAAITGLNEDGTLDASFGTDKGQTITDIGFTDDFTANAAMQSDGKIIVAGNYTDFYENINTNSYLLTRFNGYPVHVSLAVRIKRWLQNHTLSWKGLSADDKIAYYSIEQSSNNSKGFTPVAKVSGVSNLKEYSITNSSLLQGMNYYRIKAVSTDGTIRYSEVVSADNTANTASVFPNPAKDYVTVQGLQTNETANISIADGSANVKLRGVSTGAAQYRFQISNLFSGTYYINITTASKTEVLKFVKE